MRGLSVLSLVLMAFAGVETADRGATLSFRDLGPLSDELLGQQDYVALERSATGKAKRIFLYVQFCY